MRSIYVDKNIPRFLAVKAMGRAWPGVVWSPLSHARVNRVPDPPLPGPRWIRVRNRQCGICATDLTFLFGRASPGVAPVALPGNVRFYLGHEVVGDEVETGAGVRRFREGDRVAVRSGYGCGRCEACARWEPRACPKRGGTYGYTDVAKPPHLWGGYAEHMYLSPYSVLKKMDPRLPAGVAVMFNPLAAGLSWAGSVPGTGPGDRGAPGEGSYLQVRFSPCTAFGRADLAG